MKVKNISSPSANMWKCWPFLNGVMAGSGSANSVNIGCDKKICQKTHNQMKISFNKGDFIIRID